MFWREVEAVTVFVIWRERCRRIFTDKQQDVLHSVREIQKELKDRFDNLGN
jgi:hypothetical protein